MAGESYLVHGLDADAKQIEAARKYLASQGLYGKVSVEQWTSPRLPYADNLVNLVVIGEEKVSGDGKGVRNLLPERPSECFAQKVPDTFSVSKEELLRVLAPGGAIYDATAGSGQKITVKPRPPEIDEWTHFLHDAGNNAVAHDTLVGAPRPCSGWPRRCGCAATKPPRAFKPWFAAEGGCSTSSTKAWWALPTSVCRSIGRCCAATPSTARCCGGGRSAPGVGRSGARQVPG